MALGNRCILISSVHKTGSENILRIEAVFPEESSICSEKPAQKRIFVLFLFFRLSRGEFSLSCLVGFVIGKVV